MTLFRVHTSIGNFEKMASSPKDAIAEVKAAHPEAFIKKIKRVKHGQLAQPEVSR